MSTWKTVSRTIFYQFFLVFVGLSLGLIIHPEWVGNKAIVIDKSIDNIFFHPTFEEVKPNIMYVGRLRLWVFLDMPEDLNVYDEEMIGEELYTCNYDYEKDGEKITGDYETYIRWKSWESGYELKKPVDTLTE